MDRSEILELLTELSARLERRGVRGEMFLVGGAAMAVAYSTRRSTADLDSIFEPKQVIYDVAEMMRRDRDLPPHWLNDGVKGFLPGADVNARVLLELAGLRVTIGSPRYLLAMKLMASRVERDEDDLVLLLGLCAIRSVDQALDLLKALYGNRPIEAKVQFLVAELLEVPPPVV
jgi:hypothetical protein